MDFAQLLAKASSNAVSSKKKVARAEAELEEEDRRRRATQIKAIRVQKHAMGGGQQTVGSMVASQQRSHKAAIPHAPAAGGKTKSMSRQAAEVPASKSLRIAACSSAKLSNASAISSSSSRPFTPTKHPAKGSIPSTPSATSKAGKNDGIDYALSARRDFFELMQKAGRNTEEPPAPSSSSAPHFDPPVASIKEVRSLKEKSRALHSGGGGKARQSPPPLGISASIDLMGGGRRRKKPHGKEAPEQFAERAFSKKGHTGRDGRGEAVEQSVVQAEKRYLPGDLRYKPPPPSSTASSQLNQPTTSSSANTAKRKDMYPAASRFAPQLSEREAPMASRRSTGEKWSAARASLGDRRQPQRAEEVRYRRGQSADSDEEGVRRRRKLEKELAELDRLAAEKKAQLATIGPGGSRQSSGSRDLYHRHHGSHHQHHIEQPSRRMASGKAPKPAYKSPYKPGPLLTARSPTLEATRGHYEDYSDSEEEEDDEDDNDSMADFIDDGDVEEADREEFEETLKLINPRYNKEKWKERERNINLNRMHSSHRDIEREEAVSRKVGLYEDLREVQRGSKQIRE